MAKGKSAQGTAYMQAFMGPFAHILPTYGIGASCHTQLLTWNMTMKHQESASEISCMGNQKERSLLCLLPLFSVHHHLPSDDT